MIDTLIAEVSILKIWRFLNLNVESCQLDNFLTFSLFADSNQGDKNNSFSTSEYSPSGNVSIGTIIDVRLVIFY